MILSWHAKTAGFSSRRQRGRFQRIFRGFSSKTHKSLTHNVIRFATHRQSTSISTKDSVRSVKNGENSGVKQSKWGRKTDYLASPLWLSGVVIKSKWRRRVAENGFWVCFAGRKRVIRWCFPYGKIVSPALPYCSIMTSSYFFKRQHRHYGF